MILVYLLVGLCVLTAINVVVITIASTHIRRARAERVDRWARAAGFERMPGESTNDLIGRVTRARSMISLVLLALLFAAPGCCGDVELEVDVFVAADVEVKPRGLCSFYGWVESRYWLRELPYFAPPASGTMAIVEGRVVPLAGQSEPTADGNTLVWAPRELHYADGTVELGVVGHAVLEQPTWQDNPAWCEFRRALEVRQ